MIAVTLITALLGTAGLPEVLTVDPSTCKPEAAKVRELLNKRNQAPGPPVALALDAYVVTFTRRKTGHHTMLVVVAGEACEVPAGSWNERQS